MRCYPRLHAWSVLCCVIAGCTGNPAPTLIETSAVPAVAPTAAAAGSLQPLRRSDQVRALDAYLDEFHSNHGTASTHDAAHHVCAIVDAEVRQCMIYDGHGRTAKLVAVEYVVSQVLFKRLPRGERPLWHSHDDGPNGGMLIAPGASGAVQHEVRQHTVGTYGKTWLIRDERRPADSTRVERAIEPTRPLRPRGRQLYAALPAFTTG